MPHSSTFSETHYRNIASGKSVFLDGRKATDEEVKNRELFWSMMGNDFVLLLPIMDPQYEEEALKDQLKICNSKQIKRRVSIGIMATLVVLGLIATAVFVVGLFGVIPFIPLAVAEIASLSCFAFSLLLAIPLYSVKENHQNEYLNNQKDAIERRLDVVKIIIQNEGQVKAELLKANSLTTHQEVETEYNQARHAQRIIDEKDQRNYSSILKNTAQEEQNIDKHHSHPEHLIKPEIDVMNSEKDISINKEKITDSQQNEDVPCSQVWANATRGNDLRFKKLSVAGPSNSARGIKKGENYTQNAKTGTSSADSTRSLER